MNNKTTNQIYEEIENNKFSIINGDSSHIVQTLNDNSIKLMYGSPPYPNAKRNYRTWAINGYIDTIDPLLRNVIPKMRNDGFIVINVKANRIHATKDVNSERSLVIEELMIYMKKEFKLYCVDIEIWLKSNPVPTGVRVACIDAYEYNLWFSISPKWKINIDEIRRPYSKSSLNTYKNTFFKPRKNGLQYVSKEKMIEPNKLGALPINVIYGSVSSKSEHHQAVQPEYISEKYIKACTSVNDIILDPWVGSGTTGIVALKNGRKFIGIDISEDFSNLSERNIIEEIIGNKGG